MRTIAKVAVGAVAAGGLAVATATTVTLAYIKRDEVTLPACRWALGRVERLMGKTATDVDHADASI